MDNIETQTRMDNLEIQTRMDNPETQTRMDNPETQTRMDNPKTQTTLEDFGEATLVVRIRKSKKDRQHNGQKKKDKKTNNDLGNTSQKTTERATRTH
jgi:hypothetical protein